MPAWNPSGGGSSTGSVDFKDTGGGGSNSPIYRPTGSGGGTGVEGGVTPADPNMGTVSINPLDPAGSAKEGGQQLGDMLAGLRDNIFGVVGSDGGHYGGLPVAADLGGLISKTPVLGDVVKAGGDVLGGAGDTLKNAGGLVGGTLERLPDPISGGLGGHFDLERKFNDPAVQDWLDAHSDPADPTSKTNRDLYAKEGQNFDKGIAGTGLLGNEDHMRNTVLRKFAEAQLAKNPTFMPGAFETSGSLADMVTLVMNDGFGLVSNAWQRTLMGVHDRATEAALIGSGQAVSTGFLGTGIASGSKGPTPGEQLVAQKMASGEWTKDQANDFLLATGQSAHDAALSIAMAVASPDVVAGFGAGALAKLGVKGATLFRTVGEAENMVKEAELAVEAANAAKVAAKAGGAVGKELRAASKVIREAKAELTLRQAGAAALQAKPMPGVLRFGELYDGMQASNLGKVAKVTRTIIDPMHAIDLRMPGSARMVDLMSDATTKQLDKVMGVHYSTTADHMRSLDNTGSIMNQYLSDIAVASTNRAREGLLQMHQVSNVKRIGRRIVGESGADREQVIADAATAVRERDLMKWLREDYTKNVLQIDWSKSDHVGLAKALEAHYGIPKEQWLQDFEHMTKEQKSLLKFAAYGKSTDKLLQAASNARATGHAMVNLTFADGAGMERMVLLSKKTLSRVGGASLLAQLQKARTTKKAVAIIRDWQERFPELLYIPIDTANPEKSVKSMMDYLDKHMEHLPMQVTREELAQMSDDYKSLADNLGGQYDLGFRPKDEFLWGVERSNKAGGEYIAKRVPWADHVGAEQAGIGFRPGKHLQLNIAGLPIIGRPLDKAVKVADYMAAGARVLTSQVSSEQVSEIARKRFVSTANRGEEFTKNGLTESVAGQWWDRLQEYTREHQGYSGPRGFGKGDLYAAIAKESLIPQTILNGSVRFGEEDILRMVLNAYDGDMRYLGLTQKLSGRVKKVLSQATGFQSNYAGQIAEHAWPTLKFRYNPLFQLQEKIEPIVLSAQRGVSFAATPRMSEADRYTERLLQAMTDKSLVRMADIDQFEYSMYALFGKRMDNLAKTPGSKMAKLQSLGLMDVQGVKRVNMVRTFRAGLGDELKRVWDEVEPGAWDQMLEHASAKAGRMLNKDEFAVQMMAENLLGNDIKVMKTGVKNGADILSADWSNAIKTGEWHRPLHLGELKALDLEHVAKTMNTMNNGRRINGLADLRQYIAEDNTRVSDVTEYLNRLGADKDYVKRVENALTFSWEGFWHQASKRYNLTTKESMALQDMIGESANMRGMNPVDYLSQIYDPGILDGTEGIIGSLDKPVGVLRRNAQGAIVGRGRSRLEATVGQSTREDLVRQLSGVFSQHLDPSAKRALLMEFRPELRDAVSRGEVLLDPRDIKAMWDSGAENALADRILGYMDGKYGTSTGKAIKDAASGNADIRKGVAGYLNDHGVTPLGERRLSKLDEAHGQQVAFEFGAMGEVKYERTGRRPMTKNVYAANTELKPVNTATGPGPTPAGMVDHRTYTSYQQFVMDNRSQFDHMTAPKSQGGMGIKVIVAKGEPYTNDAAGEAARIRDLKKGTLRVSGLDSDHPLMTNEQVVQFRAVHEVFGYGPESLTHDAEGAQNAVASHFSVYSADSRGPLLTETHGRTSWEKYSTDSVGGHEPVPLTSDEDYIARYTEPDLQNRMWDGYGGGYNDVNYPSPTYNTYFQLPRVGPLGDDFRKLPEFVRARVLQRFADLQDQFPEFRMQHIDALAKFETPVEEGGIGMTNTTHAVAFGSEGTDPVIILNPRYFDEVAGQGWHPTMDNWVNDHGVPDFGRSGPRKSAPGTPWNAMSGPQATVDHEFGHVVLVRIRYGAAVPDGKGGFTFLSRNLPENKLVNDVLDAYHASGDAGHLSEYGARAGHEAEADADLFSVMMATPEELAYFGIHPDVVKWGEKLKQSLIDSGHMKPFAKGPAGTVRELNAAAAGTVRAPVKVGVLPQATIDQFATQFVGVGKHVEANPDVARVAQQFGKWSQAAVFNGLMRGDSAVHANLLNDIAGIPTHAASPYNYTEAISHQVAVDAMKRKWDDAFRLQYFSQDRTMLERSINHPMFGMYPASYMWGKLMPEIIQFIAQRPFGIRTGAMLSASMHAQSNIALRREFDPEFDAKMEDLGHSQALGFLGYLLPTIPWDIGASAPIWMKDIAAQGIRNQKNVASGQPVEGFDAVSPLTDSIKKLNPLEQNLGWAGRAIDELNGANTPTEQRAALVEKQGPTLANDLSPTLSAILAELRATLSK